jgi:hypothetical protein
MNLAAKSVLAALGMSLCAAVAAQGMYKCKDAAGKLTYADQECDKLGLSSAGAIKGKTSEAPALKSPPAARRPAPAPAARSAPSSAEAPKVPERRCFVVKTAKGTATRCNDVPDEDKKAE